MEIDGRREEKEEENVPNGVGAFDGVVEKEEEGEGANEIGETPEVLKDGGFPKRPAVGVDIDEPPNKLTTGAFNGVKG